MNVGQNQSKDAQDCNTLKPVLKCNVHMDWAVKSKQKERIN